MSFADFFGGVSVTGAATAVEDGSIMAVVGETKSVTIPCNQEVSASSLTFIVETKQKVDVATVANGSITKSGTNATLTLTSPMTSAERTLNWTLFIASTNETVASGLLFCTYDAQGD